jgi:hypothetical protein
MNGRPFQANSGLHFDKTRQNTSLNAEQNLELPSRAPFGTIKTRMGTTHFLMKTLPRVAAEMALHVLAYILTRVINIMTGPSHCSNPIIGCWVETVSRYHEHRTRADPLQPRYRASRRMVFNDQDPKLPLATTAANAEMGGSGDWPRERSLSLRSAYQRT